MKRLLLALGLIACPLPLWAQQPAGPTAGSAFIERRIGADALTIAELLDRLAAVTADRDRLKAEAERRKADCPQGHTRNGDGSCSAPLPLEGAAPP